LGPTLVLGGLLAFLAVPIVSALGPSADGSSGSIVLLTFAGFFLPAAVLSAVSPMVAQLVLDDLEETGSVIGGLSAAGTAGALFGTFVTGFLLVSSAPTRPVIVGVAAALCVVGFLLWVRLGGGLPGKEGKPGVLMVAMVGMSALAGIAAPSSCDTETGYSCVQVVEDPDRRSGRLLVLDTSRHSYVDIEDPTHIEFRYLRLFTSVISEIDTPDGLDTLHIGGGGFTLPQWMAATNPEANSLVLEIDAQLVDIVEAELGLVINDRLQVRTGDARITIRALSDASQDLVVGDAFSGMTVPWHLTTAEFAEEIQRVLRPEGVYVLNLIDGIENDFGRSELATLRSVFANVAVVVPSDDRLSRAAVNQVLIASDAPLRAIDFDPADGVLIPDDEVDAFIDGAKILTDDWAPVDQLRNR
jgi:hypothetical protein